MNVKRSADTPYHIPLLIYALLTAQSLNMPFINPWMVVTLAAALAAGASRPEGRIVVRQLRADGHIGHQS